MIRPASPITLANPIHLIDQFHDELVQKFISKLLCTPVHKDGSEVFNNTIHLKGYQIVPALPLKPTPIVNLTSLNAHFPNQNNLKVIKPDFLLVPTLKCVVDPNTGHCP